MIEWLPIKTAPLSINTRTELQRRLDRIRELETKNERLRAAAGNAASILSRHLAHQFSDQQSHIQLRVARDGLVTVLGPDEQPVTKEG